MNGRMLGIAASTSETWLFGSPPNSVEAPENSFELEVTWAWTSSPITISQSPVAAFINFGFAALMLIHQPAVTSKRSAPIRSREGRSQPIYKPACTNSRHCRDRLRQGADQPGPSLHQQ